MLEPITSIRVENVSINGKSTVTFSKSNFLIEDFTPISTSDPILPILRRLFLRSFEDIYQKNLSELDFQSNDDLQHWLEDTFDEEQQQLIDQQHHCLLLSDKNLPKSPKNLFAFLTFVEEDSDRIYLSQLVVRTDLKRQGCASQLLQHLRQMYPNTVKYYSLLRRINQPALKLFLKHGATIVPDEQIERDYQHDPKEYIAIELTHSIS